MEHRADVVMKPEYTRGRSESERPHVLANEVMSASYTDRRRSKETVAGTLKR
jgi:hypothetical protein